MLRNITRLTIDHQGAGPTIFLAYYLRPSCFPPVTNHPELLNTPPTDYHEKVPSCFHDGKSKYSGRSLFYPVVAERLNQAE